MKSRYLTDKEFKKKWDKRMFTHRRDIRLKLINYYGSKCNCCGETEEKFLTIDHINNDGGIHRKKRGRCSTQMYRWIIKNNYPTSLQILCWNCNSAKQYHGICPHKLTLKYDLFVTNP